MNYSKRIVLCSINFTQQWKVVRGPTQQVYYLEEFTQWLKIDCIQLKFKRLYTKTELVNNSKFLSNGQSQYNWLSANWERIAERWIRPAHFLDYQQIYLNRSGCILNHVCYQLFSFKFIINKWRNSLGISHKFSHKNTVIILREWCFSISSHFKRW